MDGLFDLLLIDGDVCDFTEPATPYLRFHDLNWEKSIEVCQLGFAEGYTCVLWKREDEENQEDNDDGR